VRLFVMGVNQWRDYESYPPPSQATRLYLHHDGALTFDAPITDESPDAYAYNPLDPTPILGGTQLSLSAGRRDNRKLESRPDVLVYTSAPLERPLEIIGAVRLELHVESDIEYADFYGRLTDVYPNGRSINLCDGLHRITPQDIIRAEDGTLCVEIDLWATAHQFKRGHRVRLIVSSGAHPRWARNLGHANQMMGTEGQCAHHRVFHDALHPSALVLPITQR
jgi:putative CocE/NonD family hydrolase